MDPDIEELAEIPADVVEEAAQFTKFNSIEGSKRGSVKVVYCFAKNLKKEKQMATGQVGFVDESKCVYVNCSTNNKLAKAILKSKEEKYPNLQSLFILPHKA